ncbi:MAG: hypothetical protein ABI782_10470 [Anaerolineaceae bacterium]
MAQFALASRRRLAAGGVLTGEKETNANVGDERGHDGQRFRTKTADDRELQDDADQSSSSDVVEGKKGPNAVNVKLA